MLNMWDTLQQCGMVDGSVVYVLIDGIDAASAASSSEHVTTDGLTRDRLRAEAATDVTNYFLPAATGPVGAAAADDDDDALFDPRPLESPGDERNELNDLVRAYNLTVERFFQAHVFGRSAEYQGLQVLRNRIAVLNPMLLTQTSAPPSPEQPPVVSRVPSSGELAADDIHNVFLQAPTAPRDPGLTDPSTSGSKEDTTPVIDNAPIALYNNNDADEYLINLTVQMPNGDEFPMQGHLYHDNDELCGKIGAKIGLVWEKDFDVFYEQCRFKWDWQLIETQVVDGATIHVRMKKQDPQENNKPKLLRTLIFQTTCRD